MYTLYMSTKWEPILDRLTDEKSLLGWDPFDPARARVVPQSQIIQRWLELRFADRGRVFLPDWASPESLCEGWMSRLQPGWRPVTRLEAALTAQGLSSQGGGWVQSDETARLLLHYADHFPEVLDAWTAGRGRHGTEVEKLWDHFTQQKRSPLGFMLFRATREGWNFELLKGQADVVVVGAAFLSQCAQAFLLKASEVLNVHHFLLKNPGAPHGKLSCDLALAHLEGTLGVQKVELCTEASNPQLRVTGCWGPKRELEEAAEAILQSIREEEVGPESFVVLAPDWKPYLPFVEEVFGGNSNTEDSLLGGPFLEFQSEDLPSQNDREGRRLVELLADTASGRWTRSLLSALVTHPWFLAAVEEAEGTDWDGWAKVSTFRWGRNQAEIKSASPWVEAHATFDEAWDRFASTLGPGSGLPDPSWQQVRSLGALAERLKGLDTAWGGVATFAGWSEAWRKVGDVLVRPNSERLADNLLREMRVPESLGSTPFSADDFRVLLLDGLGEGSYRPNFFLRGLSAGNLKRLSSVPFDTVVLLGMDEGFPRGDSPLRDDTLYDDEEDWPNLWERRDALGRTLEDTSLWHEARGAARRRLWVFYTSRAREKGETRHPTPLLKKFGFRPDSGVQTGLYHWESPSVKDGATVFERYARLGQDLKTSAPVAGLWKAAGWVLPDPDPVLVEEPDLKVWLEPLPQFLSQRLGYKSVSRWEDDPDREAWELKDWAWTPWVLEFWSQNGFQDGDWEGWMKAKMGILQGRGFLARHPLQEAWMGEIVQKAREWTQFLAGKLEHSTVQLLPGVVEAAVALSETEVVLLVLKELGSGTYAEAVSLRWFRTMAGRVVGKVPDKAFLFSPKEDASHLPASQVFHENLNAEEAWKSFSTGQSLLLGFPFLLPPGQKATNLAKMCAQEVWELARQSLDTDGFLSSVQRRFKEALEYVSQGLEMPEKAPNEFEDKWNLWLEENPWLTQ